MKNTINYKKVPYLLCNLSENCPALRLCPVLSAIEKCTIKKVILNDAYFINFLNAKETKKV